jgi:hypothetical protein
VSDFLVSPSAETSWRLEPGEFAQRVHERWPGARVSILDKPDAWAAVRFAIPFEGGTELDGHLANDGQALGFDGDLPESATVAVWVRELVPPEQELLFYDQGYEVDVPLTEGITRDEIVAAVER